MLIVIFIPSVMKVKGEGGLQDSSLHTLLFVFCLDPLSR